MSFRGRKLPQMIVALEDFGRAIGDRIDAVPFNMIVEMRGIRRENDMTSLRFHSHTLQPLGVPANLMDRDTGHDFFGALMKDHPACKQLAHHRDDVFFLERRFEKLVAMQRPVAYAISVSCK